MSSVPSWTAAKYGVMPPQSYAAIARKNQESQRKEKGHQEQIKRESSSSSKTRTTAPSAPLKAKSKNVPNVPKKTDASCQTTELVSSISDMSAFQSCISDIRESVRGAMHTEGEAPGEGDDGEVLEEPPRLRIDGDAEGDEGYDIPPGTFLRQGIPDPRRCPRCGLWSNGFQQLRSHMAKKKKMSC